MKPFAFLSLLLLATMFGANHVAARLAMDHGVDVATAVAVRSLVTAAALVFLVTQARLSWAMTPRQRGVMGMITLLVGAQSVMLYSAVARIPVGLALLAFNTYPLWTALGVRVFYGQRPPRRVLWTMPVILLGLGLALDVTGLATGLGAQAQWQSIGLGVLLSVAAAAVFGGGVLTLTQHEVAGLDGRLRTLIVMALVGLAALAWALSGTGLHWPRAEPGWWGLALLSVLYGTAITAMFIVLPRLGVVGSSPLLNVEPVAALLMAWPLLGQAIAPMQWVGAAIVVGAVMALGLRRPAAARQ